MNFKLLYRIFLFTIFVFYSVILQAQKKINAELVSYSTSTTIKNGKLTRHHKYEIGIYNRVGEEYATVEIPYSKMNRVSNVEAFIKTIDGNVVKKLSKSDILEHNSYPTYSFYEDQFVKEFTLNFNQYPYFLNVSFDEKEDEFFFIDHWFPILDVDVPTKSATLTVEVPKDYKINFYSQFISEMQKDTVDDQYIYTWTASYDGSIEDEVFAPSLQGYLPMVSVVPENFTYEIDGSYSSWESYGSWQDALVKNASDLPESEKERIRNLVKGIENKRQIIKTLYQHLQDETRYVNISIETGGLKPNPASYVSQNKYGDCKALSNYFKTVLDAVNIESYYTKVYAGDVTRKIKHEIPSQQSNHIILCVPCEQDTMWVDCTSDDPFGYVGTFIQNREVFVINNNKSFFSRTHALTPEEVLKEREVKLRLIPGNLSVADFKIIYRGKQFEILNQLESSYNNQMKETIMRDNLIDNGFEPINVNLNKGSRDSVKITLEYSAQSSNVYKKYGDDLLIKMLPLGVPKFEDPDERKYPVQINYPIYQKDELIYEIPVDYKATDFLQNTTVSSKYGTYEINSTILDDKVVIRKSFLLQAGEYPLDEYPDFFRFISSVFNIENKTYITANKKNNIK